MFDLYFQDKFFHDPLPLFIDFFNIKFNSSMLEERDVSE